MTFAVRTSRPLIADTPTVVTLTSGTAWTVLAGWQSTQVGPAGFANKVEAYGGGQGGYGTVTPSPVAQGGEGADYSAITNLALTPGASVPYVIGAPSAGGTSPPAAGGDTYFNGASIAASSVGAPGGASSSTAVGTVKFTGGTSTDAGGGAAGPGGNGGNAATNVPGVGNGGIAGNGGGGVPSPSNGNIYGGGGGSDFSSGRDGAPGAIVITFYALL